MPTRLRAAGRIRSPRFRSAGQRCQVSGVARPENLRQSRNSAREDRVRAATRPAGGRGRRGTAARGCVRRACRRLRAGVPRRPRRRWRAWRRLRRLAGSAASMASIGEFGPSSWIASLATSAAMSLMRSRSSAFSMRSVAQELSACCWIALMSRCSLARSSRATRSCSSTAAFSLRSFSIAGRRLPPLERGDLVAQFLDGALGGLVGLASWLFS